MTDITAADILAEMDSAMVYFKRTIKRYDTRTFEYQCMVQRYDALDAMRKHLRSDQFRNKVMLGRVKIKGGLE